MIDILFTGDTFLCSKNGEPPFNESIQDLFTIARHACVNLETTIGLGGVKIAKAYNFQTPPEALQYLVENNVEICSLANNHSLDFGEEGLQQTIERLKNNGINIIGIEGDNEKDLIVNGRTIRICSYFGNQKGLAELNSKTIIKDIKRNKGIVDFLIVCLHWGEEYVAYPSPEQQRMSHLFIDAGADVIIGHHPHVPQGYERYKNGYIYYSLGNFNFFVDHPYAKKLIETARAYCVSLNVEERIECEIIPIQINDNWQPSVIEDQKEKERFFKYMTAINEPLKKGISNTFYLKEVAPHYFHNHIPSWKKRVKSFGFSHFVEMIKWLLHPITYKYYVGLFISLFYKTQRY